MATKKSGSSKKAAAATAPSASKLKDLQSRLNKNKALRTKFVKDPGAVLRAEGVELGQAKETEIAKYLDQMTAPQRAVFQAELARIRVGIKVVVQVRVNVGITL
jgi:hypothetical protein